MQFTRNWYRNIQIYFEYSVVYLTPFRLETFSKSQAWAALVNMEHIKQHYCKSQPTMDPFEIIPIGPNMTTLLDMTVGRLATQNVSVTFLLTIFFFLKKKINFFLFFIENFNLWHLFLMIILYHQTKTLIGFWCRQ